MKQKAFIYTTGVGQSFTVPDGVIKITITAIGGGGAQAYYADGCPGGGGGRVKASFNVTPQAILNIYIGGGGSIRGAISLGNGYNNSNGNGLGGRGIYAGGGGSATCVTLDNDTTMLIIAGAGGGGAYITYPSSIGTGGYGGGNLNAHGGNGGNNGGGGGLDTGSGGSSTVNPGTSGSLNGINVGNGGIGDAGGGGGWGGGGSNNVQGVFSGGGGGSSFVNQDAVVGTPQYSYVKKTTGQGGTYGAGGQYPNPPPPNTVSGSPGNSGYVLITWQDPIPAQPISNICFPAGTPIKTDQGIMAIDQIDTKYHTITQNRILDITQTVTLDQFLIMFNKHCFGKNCPSENTVMTKDHKVLYENSLIPAYKFLDISSDVKKVKYTGEVLYNVLLEKYYVMNVNNLICETLHPDNLIAKIYRNRFTDEYNERVVSIMNYALENRNLYSYKSILRRIDCG